MAFLRSLPFLLFHRHDGNARVSFIGSDFDRVSRSAGFHLIFHGANGRIVSRGIFALALGVAHTGAGYALHVVLRVAQF